MEILTCPLTSPNAITNPAVNIILILLVKEEESQPHGLIKLKPCSSQQSNFPCHGVGARWEKLFVKQIKNINNLLSV